MEYQRLDKFKLPKNFRGKNLLIVQLWWTVQGSLFALSPQFMYGWRRFLLRLFGAQIGVGVLIRPTVRITYPWKVTIDDYSWIGDHVELYSLGEINIGKHTVVSQRSYICTGSHNYKKPEFDIYALPTTIGDEAWIATDVFVAPGVTIGNGCIVSARSSALFDLPAGMICVGTPAQPIKKRVN